jgi:hypothetical protein
MSHPKVIRKEVTRKLPVALDEEEREGFIEDILSAQRKEEAFKEERRAINRQIKGVVEQRLSASAMLDAGSEERPVACEEVWNFEDSDQEVDALDGLTVLAQSIATVRLDTGEILDVRPIEDHERQDSMFGQQPEPVDAPGGDAGDPMPEFQTETGGNDYAA